MKFLRNTLIGILALGVSGLLLAQNYAATSAADLVKRLSARALVTGFLLRRAEEVIKLQDEPRQGGLVADRVGVAVAKDLVARPVDFNAAVGRVHHPDGNRAGGKPRVHLRDDVGPPIGGGQYFDGQIRSAREEAGVLSPGPS